MKNTIKILIFILLPLSLSANNIQVKDVHLSNLNTGQQFTLVNFDLSWENSWRTDQGPSNWDAAWVFVKYRSNYGTWQHATLNYVNGNAGADGHIQPIGSKIQTTADGVGVFIYRADNGVGTVNWKDVQLRWNYGQDGLSPNNLVEIKVFAVEMVYVPKDAYELGGGNGSEVGRFFRGGAFQFLPYSVNSELEITVALNNGDLYYNSPIDHDAGDQQGPIPQAFPKGYAAFYCMKYEVSQAQWVDFFNTLEPAQQLNNDLTDLDHKGPNTIDRNSISWEGFGGAITENPYIPVSFPDWSEVLAYMDWAGLRPMSELEYVKACRGPESAVQEGYAWGTDEIVDIGQPITLIEKNEENEQVLNPVSEVGNARALSFDFFDDGAFRTGIYAASSDSPSREESGATYYGIMEMTGNLWEMAVTIGTPQGRAYRSNHGDGELDTDGEANVNFWPSANGKGGGLFGGSWFSVREALWLNDRRLATIGNVGYFTDVGFRAVRTAE